MNIKFITLLAAFLVSGCVTGTRSINPEAVDYQNELTTEGTIYISSMTDRRIFDNDSGDPSTPSVRGDLEDTSPELRATLIGRQRGGFGNAMGDVALPNGETVYDEMRELLTEGLESRGYTVSDDSSSPIQLDVNIHQFWGWFTPGFASISFEARLGTTLDFERGEEAESYTVTGYGIRKGQIASNEHWAGVFQTAYSDYLANLDKILDDAGH